MKFEALRILLDKGGFTAILLLITGGLLVLTAYDRFNYLYMKLTLNVEELIAKIRESVLKRDYSQAIQICNSMPHSPELSVIKSGLIAVDSGREAMKSSLGGAVLDVTRKCERRISYVALIAAVSTLLGLLGTITGLIKTFEALAESDVTKKGEILGNGISEAMYATATGLIIGIIAMVIHTILTSKTDDIVGQSQTAGYNLITWIEESERGQGK